MKKFRESCLGWLAFRETQLGRCGFSRAVEWGQWRDRNVALPDLPAKTAQASLHTDMGERVCVVLDCPGGG